VSAATSHVDVEHKIVGRCAHVRSRRSDESAGSGRGEERRRRVDFRFGRGHVMSAVDGSPERGAAEAAAVGHFVAPGELAAR